MKSISTKDSLPVHDIQQLLYHPATTLVFREWGRKAEQTVLPLRKSHNLTSETMMKNSLQSCDYDGAEGMKVQSACVGL